MFYRLFDGILSAPKIRSTILLKKRLWSRCFLVNFVRCLRTPILKDNGMAAVKVIERSWESVNVWILIKDSFNSFFLGNLDTSRAANFQIVAHGVFFIRSSLINTCRHFLFFEIVYSKEDT